MDLWKTLNFTFKSLRSNLPKKRVRIESKNVKFLFCFRPKLSSEIMEHCISLEEIDNKNKHDDENINYNFLDRSQELF